MRQPWERWVDCTDGFGRTRQMLVTASDRGLEMRLPAGEAVRLALYQAEQLRAAVVHGMEQARNDTTAGGGSR